MPQDQQPLRSLEAAANEIEQRCPDKQMPCAVAFDIAAKHGVPPGEIGRLADNMQVRLTKCQLGLFGYQPEKKIVTPAKTDHPEINTAVQDAMVDNRLACESAWQIAKRFGVPKMTVSSVCEAIAVKVKPCQLGAF